MTMNKKDFGLICKICGFLTYDYKDMCEHLAQKQEEEAENCNIKIVEVYSKKLIEKGLRWRK